MQQTYGATAPSPTRRDADSNGKDRTRHEEIGSSRWAGIGVIVVIAGMLAVIVGEKAEKHGAATTNTAK